MFTQFNVSLVSSALLLHAASQLTYDVLN